MVRSLPGTTGEEVGNSIAVSGRVRTGAVTLIQRFGPALNLESQGRVVYGNTQPFRDGSTHVVLGITAIKTYCEFRSLPLSELNDFSSLASAMRLLAESRSNSQAASMSPGTGYWIPTGPLA